MDVIHIYLPILLLVEIASANPALTNSNIRVDKATQQVSVIDVIRLITGHKSNNASRVVSDLSPELAQKMSQLRINGKGKKTRVCDASTMVEIIWELPGKAAKVFRRQCAHYIVRILGGDASLVEEMRNRAETSTSSQRDFFLGKRGTDNRERDESAARKLKLRREEAEIAQLEVETKLYVKEREIGMKKRKIEMNKSSVTYYRDLVQEMFKGDAHMQAAFKDYTLVTLGDGTRNAT